MFLDVASFKKELKSSYKGLGVEITHFENDMVSIAGTGWIIEVGMEDITKKGYGGSGGARRHITG